jgi:6-phosphogluconolactonase
MTTENVTLVYVANAESQDIAVLQLAPDGALTPVTTVPVPGPTKPGLSLPLAVNPSGTFLYAALRNAPYSVAAFTIEPRVGRLAFVGSTPLTNSMAYIGTDRTGSFLLGASYHGNEVTVSPIAPNGTVGRPGQVIENRPKAHCILTDASNRYALHTSLGGDVVHQERFDAGSGTLSSNDPPAIRVEANAGPRHLTFAPGGNFVYLVGELDAAIRVFPYDAAKGTLAQEIQVASALPKRFSGTPWAADIHLTPDGGYLYASERTSSTLAAFRVDPANGVLTPIGSYATARQPRAFNIDPSGRYLLSAGQLSNSMVVYSIDAASGALTALEEYPTGRSPSWVEVVRLP